MADLSDHDLLIRLDERHEHFSAEVLDRLKRLEEHALQGKASRDRRSAIISTGVAGTVMAIFEYFKAHLK